jgi:hypothetical protein
MLHEKPEIKTDLTAYPGIQLKWGIFNDVLLPLLRRFSFTSSWRFLT